MRPLLFIVAAMAISSPAAADVLGTDLACALYNAGGKQAVYSHAVSATILEDETDAAVIINDGTELVGFEFACGVGDGELLCEGAGDRDLKTINYVPFSQKPVGDGLEVVIGDDAPVTLRPCK